MLLKRFTDAEGLIWTFNKARPERGVRATSTFAAFVENHRYSVKNADGSKDPAAEYYLSEIEGAIDPFLSRLVETVRAGRTPSITPAEHQLWNEFVRVQWLRRSDVVAVSMPDDEFNQFLDERLEALAPVLEKFPDYDEANVRDPSWRERMRHNVAAQLVTHPLHLVQHTLSNMGLAIAVSRKPNKSFVIGSHPIVRCEPAGGGDLGTPGVEMWFPVAKDVAISPLPERGRVLVLNDIPDADLRRLNVSIFKQSREVGSCSKALIESLVSAA